MNSQYMRFVVSMIIAISAIVMVTFQHAEAKDRILPIPTPIARPVAPVEMPVWVPVQAEMPPWPPLLQKGKGCRWPCKSFGDPVAR